jgi:hypothetical protein
MYVSGLYSRPLHVLLYQLPYVLKQPRTKKSKKVTSQLRQHYIPHIHHPGLSYPMASIQPHKTTKMPNNESRLSPRIFQMKFLFDFIYSLTITHNNHPDLCSLLYPVISPYLYHHSPSGSLLSLVPLCVGTQKCT